MRLFILASALLLGSFLHSVCSQADDDDDPSIFPVDQCIDDYYAFGSSSICVGNFDRVYKVWSDAASFCSSQDGTLAGPSIGALRCYESWNNVNNGTHCQYSANNAWTWSSCTERRGVCCTAPISLCRWGSYHISADECKYCPAGRYGNAKGLQTSSCSGLCTVGHYCPEGTNSPVECPAGRYGDQQGLVTSGCSGDCKKPHYCDRGETVDQPPGKVCKAGRYAYRDGQVNDLCDGPCYAGYYCEAGSTVPNQHQCGGVDKYCPEGSSAPQTVQPGKYSGPLNVDAAIRSQALVCPPGHYCSGGVKLPCPAGKYGGGQSLSTASCSGPCSAGYYCQEGSTTSTAAKCGDVSKFCPQGSASPSVVRSGYYSGPVNVAVDVRSTEVDCEKGFYCVGGERKSCPAGRYGNQLRLTASSCTGACEAGYYCPAASQSPQEVECGGINRMCPAASGTFTIVDPGRYSTPLSAPETRRTGSKACEPGHWCAGGVRSLCPPGFYGSDPSLSSSTCSGKCSAGYYCQAGSTTAEQFVCGNVTVFCPLGSEEPSAVPDGSYSRPLSVAEDVRRASSICEAGYWCSSGRRKACPAGRFGSVTGLNSIDCSGPCSAGYFCPASSTSSEQQACGDIGLYCPGGSGSPLPVPSGHYSTPLSALESRRTSYSLCEIGYYCSSGRRSLCAAGNFGNSTGLTVSSCSGPCSAGYYCKEGSLVPVQYECGNQTVFCPMGSSSPAPVPIDFFSLPEAGPESIREEAAQCPPGSWCELGRRHLCPAGRYGSRTGETASACTGPCARGFYCGPGSTISTEAECGSISRFCPEGSSNWTVVPSGFYSTPLARPPTQRFTITQCEPGHFCHSGQRFPCPAGRYGEEPGLESPSCSGPCQAGYYCPEGSVSAQEVPCGGIDRFCEEGSGNFSLAEPGYYTAPVSSLESIREYVIPCNEGNWCRGGIRSPCAPGHFGNTTHLSSSTCSGKCSGGYYCVAGSTTPMQNECGQVDRYCPPGSTSWSPVPEGHYSAPLDADEVIRSAARPCDRGFWCVGARRTACPAGRFGNASMEVRPTCSGPCFRGYFCPLNSTQEDQIPCGGIDRFCPPSSPTWTMVPPGFYSSPLSASSMTRYSIEECEPGHWCILGARHECPAGTYGANPGLSTKECSGPCHSGYYCINGSTVPDQFECGAVSRYCPEGSGNWSTVPPGYYSVDLTTSPVIRSGSEGCEWGHWCESGERFKCDEVCYCPPYSPHQSQPSPLPLPQSSLLRLVPDEAHPWSLLEGTTSFINATVISEPLQGQLSIRCATQPGFGVAEFQVVETANITVKDWDKNSSVTLPLAVNTPDLLARPQDNGFISGSPNNVSFVSLSCQASLRTGLQTLTSDETRVVAAIVHVPRPLYFRSYFIRSSGASSGRIQRQTTTALGFVAITRGEEDLVLLQDPLRPDQLPYRDWQPIGVWKWDWYPESLTVSASLTREDGKSFHVDVIEATYSMVQLRLPTYDVVCNASGVMLPTSNVSGPLADDYCFFHPYHRLSLRLETRGRWKHRCDAHADAFVMAAATHSCPPDCPIEGLGLTYVPLCQGFLDTDECFDSSSAHLCAYGERGVCSNCPEGGICPGGSRAWVLPGYWTPSEESTVVIKCAPPAIARCPGWSVSQRRSLCGKGYDDNSVACSACEKGYYDMDGACYRCPSTDSGIVVKSWPLLIASIAIVPILFLIMWFSIYSALKRYRPEEPSIVGRSAAIAMDFCITGVIVVQQIALVAQTSSPGLPPWLRAAYDALQLLRFNIGGVVPADCLEGNPFMTHIVILSIALCATCLSFLLIICDRRLILTGSTVSVRRRRKLPDSSSQSQSQPDKKGSNVAVQACGFGVQSIMLRLSMTVAALTYTVGVATSLAILFCQQVDDGTQEELLWTSNPTFSCFHDTHFIVSILAATTFVCQGIFFPVFMLCGGSRLTRWIIVIMKTTATISKASVNARGTFAGPRKEEEEEKTSGRCRRCRKYYHVEETVHRRVRTVKRWAPVFNVGQLWYRPATMFVLLAVACLDLPTLALTDAFWTVFGTRCVSMFIFFATGILFFFLKPGHELVSWRRYPALMVSILSGSMIALQLSLAIDAHSQAEKVQSQSVASPTVVRDPALLTLELSVTSHIIMWAVIVFAGALPITLILSFLTWLHALLGVRRCRCAVLGCRGAADGAKRIRAVSRSFGERWGLSSMCLRADLEEVREDQSGKKRVVMQNPFFGLTKDSKSADSGGGGSTRGSTAPRKSRRSTMLRSAAARKSVISFNPLANFLQNKGSNNASESGSEGFGMNNPMHSPDSLDQGTAAAMPSSGGDVERQNALKRSRHRRSIRHIDWKRRAKLLQANSASHYVQRYVKAANELVLGGGRKSRRRSSVRRTSKVVRAHRPSSTAQNRDDLSSQELENESKTHYSGVASPAVAPATDAIPDSEAQDFDWDSYYNQQYESKIDHDDSEVPFDQQNPHEEL